MAKAEPIQFECVKIGQSQNKDGWTLRLAIHPQDMNEAIALAPSGSRYMCVLVEMPESEEDADRQEAERAVLLAGIICKELEFHRFIKVKYDLNCNDEKSAVAVLRELLNIKSRADLKSDKFARQEFMELYRRYHDYKVAQ